GTTPSRARLQIARIREHSSTVLGRTISAAEPRYRRRSSTRYRSASVGGTIPSGPTISAIRRSASRRSIRHPSRDCASLDGIDQAALRDAVEYELHGHRRQQNAEDAPDHVRASHAEKPDDLAREKQRHERHDERGEQ